MANDLADILDEQDAQSTSLALATAQVRDFISALGREVVFADASLEERSTIAEQLETLLAIEAAARARRHVIETEIVAAGKELEAREFPIDGGAIRLESTASYKTKDAALHDALTALVAHGDVTRDEVEAAVRTEITYRPDHRRLNALLKRGGRVQAAIESNRERMESDPRVRINRKGGQR